MNEEILQGLENEIIEIGKFNEKLSSDTEAYTKSNEAYCKLCETYEKLIKADAEIKLNEKKALIESKKTEAEIKNAENQVEYDRQDKVWNWIFRGVAAGTTALGIGVTVWAYKMGWRLELDKDNPEILTNTPGKESYKMIGNLLRKVF